MRDLLTDDPDIDTIKKDLLNKIAEANVLLETFDYSERIIIPVNSELKYLTKLEDYVSGGDVTATVMAFHNMVRELLQEYETFISECKEEATILRLREGLMSHTMDIRRFKTVTQEKEAKEAGEPAAMQDNPRLQVDVAMALSKAINAPNLIRVLEGDNPDQMEIVKLMRLSTSRFPKDNEGFIKIYKDFMSFLNVVGSNMSIQEALPIMIDFLVALKQIADYSTDKFIKDMISNIFMILSNYFIAAEIGSLLSPDEEI